MSKFTFFWFLKILLTQRTRYNKYVLYSVNLAFQLICYSAFLSHGYRYIIYKHRNITIYLVHIIILPFSIYLSFLSFFFLFYPYLLLTFFIKRCSVSFSFRFFKWSINLRLISVLAPFFLSRQYISDPLCWRLISVMAPIFLSRQYLSDPLCWYK